MAEVCVPVMAVEALHGPHRAVCVFVFFFVLQRTSSPSWPSGCPSPRTTRWPGTPTTTSPCWLKSKPMAAGACGGGTLCEGVSHRVCVSFDSLSSQATPGRHARHSPQISARHQQRARSGGPAGRQGHGGRAGAASPSARDGVFFFLFARTRERKGGGHGRKGLTAIKWKEDFTDIKGNEKLTANPPPSSQCLDVRREHSQPAHLQLAGQPCNQRAHDQPPVLDGTVKV